EDQVHDGTPARGCVRIAPIMESAPEGMQMRNNSPSTGRLFSVGHSNHDPAGFLRLLRLHGVTALADVRSSPYSQRYPQFNREELRRALRDADVLYVFLGDQLGGRPAPRDLYDDEGRVDYGKVRATDFFR